MKTIAITLGLALAASIAMAGSVTVVLTAEQDAALSSIVTKRNAERAARVDAINAERAQRLAEMNIMRDAALPKLTAVEAGLAPLTASQANLAPLTAAEVLISLAKRELENETKTLADNADSVAAEAVRAIRLKAADCATKATAAGLDPIKVCR